MRDSIIKSLSEQLEGKDKALEVGKCRGRLVVQFLYSEGFIFF